MNINKELKNEMDEAIGVIMKIKEQDMTKAERKSVEHATELGISEYDRVARVCDMLTTFGIQDQERFNRFFSLINQEIPE